MSEPTFTPSLETLYSGLPEHYRTSDIYNDYALKKFLSGVAKPLEDVETLYARFDYTPPEDGGDPDSTSDLVNPLTADAEWLPWLAQLLGVNPKFVNEESREQLAGASRGFNPGTAESMIAAGRTALVGERYIGLYDHSTGLGLGTGGTWDVLLITRDSETLKNLFPEWVATISSASNWVVSTDSSNDDTFLKSYAVDPSLNVYKNRVLTIRPQAESVQQDISLGTLHHQAISGGDPFQVMIHAGLYQSAPDATKTGNFGLRYYDAYGNYMSTLTTPITLTANLEQLSYRTVSPLGAASCSVSLRVNEMTENDIIAIAQLGLRRESIKDWIPTTAEPIKRIIERGAKPAGVILHNVMFAATWDALEATYPTMVDLEGRTWTQIEELDTSKLIVVVPDTINAGFGFSSFGTDIFGS